MVCFNKKREKKPNFFSSIQSRMFIDQFSSFSLWINRGGDLFLFTNVWKVNEYGLIWIAQHEFRTNRLSLSDNRERTIFQQTSSICLSIEREDFFDDCLLISMTNESIDLWPWQVILVGVRYTLIFDWRRSFIGLLNEWEKKKRRKFCVIEI